PDLLAAAALGDRGANEMGSPVEETTLALLHEALAQLADTDSCLRARVLSRLAGTPPYADSMQQRATLSSDALALARQTRAPSALRDALAARLWACLGPDHIDERLAVAQEILALADWQRDKQMALLGHDAQLGAHLLRGDAAAADRALAAYVAIAEELRQPAFLFQATFCQGSRALARGEFERAEQLFRAALDRGRGTVPYAHFMFTGQMMTLHYTRGDLDDEGLSQVFFGEMMALPYSWVPAIRAALALFRLVRGETEAARGEFENLCAPGFEGLSRGDHWRVTMASPGNVAALLDDRRHGEQLYDLLRPFAQLTVVHDQLRSTGGSVATVLGNLATMLGRFDDGAAHYEQALANETAMQAAPAVLVTK